jgi:hypothetical protein
MGSKDSMILMSRRDMYAIVGKIDPDGTCVVGEQTPTRGRGRGQAQSLHRQGVSTSYDTLPM